MKVVVLCMNFYFKKAIENKVNFLNTSVTLNGFSLTFGWFRSIIIGTNF